MLPGKFIPVFAILNICCFLSLSAIASGGSEIDFSAIDSFAINAPADISTDSSAIAAYLLKACSNDAQKARAAFTWIANNIRYDDYEFNTGKMGNMSATAVLKRKHAVCEGYANLYLAIAKAMGLEAEKIDGYAKAYGYHPGQKFTGTDPNHAWNAVKINGDWTLLDVTWGAGYSDGGRGKLVSHKLFSPYWFNVDKYEFLFMHYPKDEKWLLAPEKLSLREFEEMPFAQYPLFQMGFDAHDILNKFLSKTAPTKLPEAFPVKYKIKLVDFPLSGTIPPAREASFTIICDDNVEIMIINDPKQGYPMKKEGNKYAATLPLKKGELQIGVKGKGKTYDDIIRYQVK